MKKFNLKTEVQYVIYAYLYIVW